MEKGFSKKAKRIITEWGWPLTNKKRLDERKSLKAEQKLLLKNNNFSYTD